MQNKYQPAKLSEHFRKLRFQKCQRNKFVEHFGKLRFQKRAQIWYTDFMLGILIFVVVIFIYFGYAHSFNQDPSEITSELLMDAKAISSSLVTSGSPSDWNQTNVEIIGLTNGNQRLVDEKIEMFANLSLNQARTKLRTPYKFYVYLTDLNGTIVPMEGYQGVGQEAIDPDNLVAITRVVVHDSTLKNMVVQVWL